MRKILFLALIFLSFFLFPYQALAQERDFASFHDVSYEIDSTGKALVTQKVRIENLTSQYYVSNYTLTIGSTTISDVVATDELGILETVVNNEPKKTSINVKFGQQIAGVGKSQTFTLKFKSSDFASHVGKVWEVNLPKLPTSTNIEKYSLLLSVPTLFGEPVAVSPPAASESQTVDRFVFTYTKDQLINNGISINFGSSQVFDFSIKYQLTNPSLFSALTSVTLPSDTAHQDVAVSRILPPPLNVTIDKDGNYLAWYKLSRNSDLQVNISGSARINIKSKFKKAPSLVSSEISELTKSDNYWEKDNPSVKATLEQIFSGSEAKTRKDKARLIYQYVVKTLTYDTKKASGEVEISRLGAVTALNNPTAAVCMEFTDLFIALTRAAGIPSRELDGFAYSQNKSLRPTNLSKNVLHAWPEYYDETEGWVMVDPTWENTSGGVDYFNKFDLNHLVLAIKGHSSESPYISDDVEVEVSEFDLAKKPEPIITIETGDQLIAGLQSDLSIKVSNHGSSLIPASVLKIAVDKILLEGGTVISLGPIPPFGFAEYSTKFKTPFNISPYFEEVKVSVESLDSANTFLKTQSKSLNIKPLFLFNAFPLVLILSLFIIILTYVLVLLLHIKGKSLKSFLKLSRK